MFSLDYIKGKRSLAKAYWIYNILVPFTVIAVTAISCSLAITYAPNLLEPIYYGLLLAFIIAYTFGCVASWQCAWNCKRRIWSWLVILLNTFSCIMLIDKNSLTLENNKGADIVLFVSAYISITALTLIFAYVIKRGNKAEKIYYFFIPSLLGLLTILTTTHDTLLESKFVPYAELYDGKYYESYRYSYNSKATQDYEKKQLESYKKQAQTGDIEAIYALAQFYHTTKTKLNNDAESFKWMTIAANNGHNFAKNDLGVYYLSGIGTKKDIPMAIKLFKESAKSGDYYAKYNIGLHYESGEGLPQNQELAAKYYQEAIEDSEGFSMISCASNNLGALYATGKGVKRDDRKALLLFEDAVMKHIKVDLPVYHKIQRDDLDGFPQAFAQYRLAIAQGNPVESLNLKSNMLSAVKLIAEVYHNKCRA